MPPGRVGGSDDQPGGRLGGHDVRTPTLDICCRGNGRTPIVENRRCGGTNDRELPVERPCFVASTDGRKPPAEIRCAYAKPPPQIDAAATTARAGTVHRAAERAIRCWQPRLQWDNNRPIVITSPPRHYGNRKRPRRFNHGRHLTRLTAGTLSY